MRSSSQVVQDRHIWLDMGGFPDKQHSAYPLFVVFLVFISCLVFGWNLVLGAVFNIIMPIWKSVYFRDVNDKKRI